ncbi:MAG: hypothetical protein ACRER2_05660 [Methylococcales bacterium]
MMADGDDSRRDIQRHVDSWIKANQALFDGWIEAAKKPPNEFRPASGLKRPCLRESTALNPEIEVRMEHRGSYLGDLHTNVNIPYFLREFFTVIQLRSE